MSAVTCSQRLAFRTRSHARAACGTRRGGTASANIAMRSMPGCGSGIGAGSVVLLSPSGRGCSGMFHRGQGTVHGRALRNGFWVAASASPDGASTPLSATDLEMVKEAAVAADGSAGLTIPHPNHACIITGADGEVIARAFQYAQGTTSAEVQAVAAAGAGARGGTAYLNLESGDCHGDDSAVNSLIEAGVTRVVVGLKHPLKHLHGRAIEVLAGAGVEVQVLGFNGSASGPESDLAAAEEEAVLACLRVNEPLLHRTVTTRPFSVLKYAMTMDGKIATAQGHSAWDAVIVGGNTVRRDNPRLTTRREGGHIPVRVVMSRTLDLPEDANLWDTSSAPTIVMTQRGARAAFQEHLRSKGVEVIEFAFLSPSAVIEYCYSRGFMQCLWECGGMLSAPAISGGVIHKTMAFIAPKIIGGARAPTPVGELGFVEMTQAVDITDTTFEVVGSDMMMTGYLPASGGLRALAEAAEEAACRKVMELSEIEKGAGRGAGRKGAGGAGAGSAGAGAGAARRGDADEKPTIFFYKAWDAFGALSNFSPHPIVMAEEGGGSREWNSVEHYYQGQKFSGVPNPEAAALYDEVAASASPEEAARIGRRAERLTPHLVRADWKDVKMGVMYRALRHKFRAHPRVRQLLLSTANVQEQGGGGGMAELMEQSPSDTFWGTGIDGRGANHLGKLLMKIRDELLEEEASS